MKRSLNFDRNICLWINWAKGCTISREGSVNSSKYKRMLLATEVSGAIFAISIGKKVMKRRITYGNRDAAVVKLNAIVRGRSLKLLERICCWCEKPFSQAVATVSFLQLSNYIPTDFLKYKYICPILSTWSRTCFSNRALVVNHGIRCRGSWFTFQ